MPAKIALLMEKCKLCQIEFVSRICNLFWTVEVEGRTDYPNKKTKALEKDTETREYFGRTRLRVSEWFASDDAILGCVKQMLGVGERAGTR